MRATSGITSPATLSSPVDGVSCQTDGGIRSLAVGARGSAGAAAPDAALVPRSWTLSTSSFQS